MLRHFHNFPNRNRPDGTSVNKLFLSLRKQPLEEPPYCKTLLLMELNLGLNRMLARQHSFL